MDCGHGGISGIHRGGKTFGELCLQGQNDGYSVRNIVEGSFSEEVVVSGTGIFEVGFKFAASETRKNFYSTYSAD